MIRLPELIKICGLSKATVYRLSARGLFPKPSKIGVRASGWSKQQVDQWMADRVREGAV
ncbi:MAG: AlpA family phage regulatory protein [Pseudomonadota bacterium]